MGSMASKTWNDMLDFYSEEKLSQDIEDNDSVDNKPKLCYNVYLAEDPRSPSMDIDRTPIQMIDPKQTHIVIDSDKWSHLSDPRSPTVGIERTPMDMYSSESSIINQLSAMRLSFGSHSNDSINESIESQSNDDKSLLMTPLSEKQVLNQTSLDRVRTPLSSVQQKTPINVRQRKSLNIEKRAHFNSHLLKNKLIAKNVSHEKENM